MVRYENVFEYTVLSVADPHQYLGLSYGHAATSSLTTTYRGRAGLRPSLAPGGASVPCCGGIFSRSAGFAPNLHRDFILTTLDSDEIQRLIPHRYPFLLIDRVMEIEPGKRIVGLKNVTANEHFFQGHFPGYPIMPGVMIVEALAQAGAVLLLSDESARGQIPLFAGIEKCRFRQQVVPGDTLTLELAVIARRGPVGK